MIQLEIGNSYSKLSGYTAAQFAELRRILSYEADPQAAYFSGNIYSTRRFLIDKKGSFPTGLLYLVEEFLCPIKGVKTVDNRRVPTSRVGFNMRLPITPYPEQLDAATSLIERNRGIISACTGFGKSIVIALIITALRVKTLVVVPNLQLKQQLTKSLTEYFGNMNHITVENIDSPKLNTTGDYDCLIIDEAHHVAAKTYQTLNKTLWNGVYYRAFLTATPFRTRSEERMLFEAIAGRVIYSIDYKQAAAKGYVVPLEAYYVELPKTKVTGATWPQVYSHLVSKNDNRNAIIANLLLSLTAKGVSTLCLVKEIAHGHGVIKHIARVTNDDGVPFAHGENEHTEAIIKGFNSRIFTGVVGTTGVMGEGVDTKPAEFVIIAGLGKSKVQFMQQVGRALRNCEGKESAKVILFKDKSHKWTAAHFNAQVSILKEEYGVIPIKLDL